MSDWQPALQELASAASVETRYWEVDGTEHIAPPEVLVAILATLGVEIDRPQQALGALRRWQAATWRRPLEPCAAVIAGQPAVLPLRLPEAATGSIEILVSLESGEVVKSAVDLAALPVARGAEVEGKTFVERRLAVPELPIGYHRLAVDGAGVSGSCHLMVAPPRAWRGPGELRTWGLFAPVYALRSASQLGTGDLGDLAEICRLVGGKGGGVVGTLPLLASFYGEPFSPSPYSPVSRLHWNETLADLRPSAWAELGLPGTATLADPDLREAAAPLQALELVDYRRAFALKRGVIDRLAAAVWAESSARARLEAFATAHPGVEDYARFRAATETAGKPWQEWQASQRDGRLGDGDYNQDARRAHLLGQFVMRAQLAAIKANDEAAGLYLDLPVGVDGRGYDLWRERDSFADGISVGAPPDPLARSGQNWAVPPLHPVRQRENGYRYFIDCVRAHMEPAAMMRIDHVMGLHRLFWIPPDGGPADGVYVRYPAEEMYAVLCIESHRQSCAVAGEDLGTVPDDVRPAMAERGLHGLFVAEFEWDWKGDEPALRAPRPGAVACLDTHDTPPFAGFAAQAGIKDPESVMWRWTEQLAASDADLLLVTAEDIWLEAKPQNVPGTFGDDAPNWRRRMQLTVEELAADRRVIAMLDTVERARRR